MLKQSEMKDCSSLVPDLLPYDTLLSASALSECHGLTPYCALMYHQLVLKLVCHIIRGFFWHCEKEMVEISHI